MKANIIRPLAQCPRYPDHKVIRGKKIAQSGAIMIYDYCPSCDRIVTAGGSWIPKHEAGDIETIPVLEDYRRHAEPCAVCGSFDGSEWHHWAPKNVFGVEEAETWPGHYLCLAHHNYWHERMQGYMRYAKSEN